MQDPEAWPPTAGGLGHRHSHGREKMGTKLIFWFASNYSSVYSFSSWVMVLSSSCSNSGCSQAQPHCCFLCPLQPVLFLARVSYSAICCKACPLLSSLLIFSLIPFFPLSLGVNTPWSCVDLISACLKPRGGDSAFSLANSSLHTFCSHLERVTAEIAVRATVVGLL